MNPMILVLIGSLVSLTFAGINFNRVKKESEGTQQMIKISGAVRKGANAYLKRQYTGVGILWTSNRYYTGIKNVFDGGTIVWKKY